MMSYAIQATSQAELGAWDAGVRHPGDLQSCADHLPVLTGIHSTRARFELVENFSDGDLLDFAISSPDPNSPEGSEILWFWTNYQ